MKLHKNVAPCNINITKIAPKLELCHQNNFNRSSSVEISMLDSGREARNTKLMAGNTLVFGLNPNLNRKISTLVQEAFIAGGHDVITIDADQFLAMPDEKRNNSDVLYIIICSDLHICSSELTTLKKQTSNQIICKLPGLEAKGWNRGIHFLKQAELITDALGIKENDRVALGLLASLDNKGFCLDNSKIFTKRVF